MTKEELEKNYYANRPIEPYSSDDCPNDWANIAYYAEENLDRAFKRIVELECECRRCVHTDCSCILSDYGKDINGICDHFKDIFDENVELKKELVGFRLKVETLEGKTPWKDIKDKSEVIGKLIKAKEIIGNLLGLLPDEVLYHDFYNRTYVAPAEQFLNSEVEK